MAAFVAACSGDETTVQGTPTAWGASSPGGSGGSGGTVTTGGSGATSSGGGTGAIGGQGGAAGQGGEATGGLGGAGGVAGGGAGGVAGGGGAGGNTCPTWYADVDEDGYGDPDSFVQDCSQPTGYVDNADDCDDADGDVNPAESEICDGKDNDCSGTVDDGMAVTFDGTNYPTIQEGLDAAETAGAGTVYVCPGTYQENLDVAGNVTLLGVAGPELTIVEPASGQETTRVVTVGDALSVRVEGLTLRGSNTSADGGGLWASTGGATEVVGCIVTGNGAANGGGIYLEDGELWVTDCTIDLNTATGDGGGLYAAGGSVHVAADTGTAVVRANQAARGAGIAVVRSATALAADLAIDGVSVTENIASLRGGGLFVLGTDAAGGSPTLNVALAGATIGGADDAAGNSANEGGGIAAVTSAALSLDGLSSVAHNQASAAGGGMLLEGVIDVSGPSLQNAPTITANRSGNHAGGISVSGQCELSFLVVSSNTSAGHGGGMRLTLEQSAPTILLTGVRVQDNQAGTDAAGEGGGIAVSTGRVNLTDCEIWDNRGVTGGGIVVQADSNVLVIGGSVLRNGWDMDPDPDLGGGAWIKAGSGQLSVSGSDWGEGTDDNLPFDVWVTAGTQHSYTGYGAGSTFTCTNTACG